MTDEEKNTPLSDETNKQDVSQPDASPSEDAPVQSAPEAGQTEGSESQPGAGTPTDADPLGDVRRELMEEEEAKPKSKWRGIFKRKKKTEQAEETKLVVEGKIAEPPAETVDVSRIDDRAHVQTEEPRKGTGPLSERRVTGPLSLRKITGPLSESALPPGSEAPVKPAPGTPPKEDVLKSILGIDTSNLPVEAQEVTAPEQSEETVVIDKARRREILRPQEDEEKAEDIEAIREEALKEYSDEPVRPETEPSLEQKTRILVRGIRPFDRILLIGILSVMLIAGLFGVGMVLNSRQPPPPTATVDPTIPYPVGLTLPGGWSFQLKKGQVVDGEWNPTSPEWLEGTEI